MVFESLPMVVYRDRAQHRNEEVQEVIGKKYQVRWRPIAAGVLFGKETEKAGLTPAFFI